MSELAVRKRPLLADAATLTARGTRLSVRTLDALILALALPVLLMLVFVYFFGGAIDTGTAYVTYVTPGVLVLCAGYGAASTAQSVANDMKNGIIDRFRAMNVGGTSLLTGHVMASVARNTVASTLVFAVAFAIGFRPQAGPAGWVAAIAVLLAYIFALSWIAAAFGLLVKSPEAAGGFTFFVAFLPYPSSAFVPIDTMPTWLRGFAENQPVTPVIESLRGLLLDTGAGDNPWLALGWCAGLTLLAALAAGVLFARRTD